MALLPNLCELGFARCRTANVEARLTLQVGYIQAHIILHKRIYRDGKIGSHLEERLATRQAVAVVALISLLGLQAAQTLVAGHSQHPTLLNGWRHGVEVVLRHNLTVREQVESRNVRNALTLGNRVEVVVVRVDIQNLFRASRLCGKICHTTQKQDPKQSNPSHFQQIDLL